MKKHKIISPIHWPIQFQIILVLIASFMVINFIVGQIYSRYEEPELRMWLKEKNYNDYWLLHAAVTEAVISEDIPLIESFATEIVSSDKNIIYLEIKNEEGVSLVMNDTSEGIEQTYVMSFAESFIIEGERFGSMKISWNLHSIYEASSRYSKRTQIVIFSTLVALTIMILSLLHWLLIRPVRKIHQRLREISNGELTGKLSLSASSELMYLSHSVNDLSEALLKRKGYEREIVLTKQVVEHLSKQNELILNSAGEGIYGLDKHGRVTFVNPAAGKMIGWDPEELVGEDLCDLLHYTQSGDSVCSKDGHTLCTVRDGGGICRIEGEVFRRKDGSSFPVEYVCSPIIENGETTGSVVIFKDISERVKADKELHAAVIQREHANKVKSEFLAVMSHEIRTPLNAIIGASNLLLETPLQKEQKIFADTAASSGQMLLALINDILDYSKLDEGKMVLEKGNFNIVLLVEEMCELFRIDAEKKDIVIKVLRSSDVPEVINGDSGRVRQVLMNLVSNAIKFTKSGSIKVTIEFNGELDGRLLLSLKVQDTGIGIPEEVQGILFDEFSQVDASFARKYGGTGLGLAIVRNIVNLMDGDILCESEEGTGSTFTVNLKLWKASDDIADDGVIENLKNEIQDEVLVVKNGRILLVEDSMANQVIAMAYLKKAGYTVDAVAEGNEALTALNSRPYDLVLMDISMPGMDGFEATKQIRNLQGDISRIPIVAMTANAMQGDREACLRAGMNDYLSKPVNKKVLLSKVSQWLSSVIQGEDSESEIKTNTNESERPLVDYDVLQQLEKDTSAEIALDIINVFLKETDKRIKRISEACSTKDYSILQQESHVLKSSAGTYGALRLQQIAIEVDSACKQQRKQDAMELSLKLVGIADRSLDMLAEHVGQVKKVNVSVR